jgi:DNA-directed RNA polymerase specialized sigma24 family protein
MNDSQPYAIELTGDRIDFVRRVARKLARKYCFKFVQVKDVIQEVHLNLLRKPPKYKPGSRATEKTFLYAAVRFHVMKYAEREARQAKWHRQLQDRPPEPVQGEHDKPVKPMDRQKGEFVELRPCDLTWKGLTADDILRYIDDETSRHLCTTVLLCDGNLSEAGRRLRMPESTVRYRLKVLGPKLLAAGFNPYRQESYVHDE